MKISENMRKMTSFDANLKHQYSEQVLKGLNDLTPRLRKHTEYILELNNSIDNHGLELGRAIGNKDPEAVRSHLEAIESKISLLDDYVLENVHDPDWARIEAAAQIIFQKLVKHMKPYFVRISQVQIISAEIQEQKYKQYPAFLKSLEKNVVNFGNQLKTAVNKDDVAIKPSNSDDGEEARGENEASISKPREMVLEAFPAKAVHKSNVESKKNDEF